jgi:hypothetical protein
MISPNEIQAPENVFGNCKNDGPGVRIVPSSSEAKIPIGGGKLLSVSQHKKYVQSSDSQRRLARMPYGVKTLDGSLSPDDLEGKTPSQLLEECGAELGRMTDAFFIFYRLIGIAVETGKFAEHPWHAKTRDEFLGRFARTYDGSPAPRNALNYVNAAKTYLAMALDLQEGRTTIEPPSSISHLVLLSAVPAAARCDVLREAIRDAKDSRLGPILRQKVMAFRSAQPAATSTKRTRTGPAESADQPDPTPVWKALQHQTQGLPLDQKVQFWEHLVRTVEGRIREGLDPFRPIPKTVQPGCAVRRSGPAKK